MQRYGLRPVFSRVQLRGDCLKTCVPDLAKSDRGERTQVLTRERERVGELGQERAGERRRKRASKKERKGPNYATQQVGLRFN